MTTIRRVGAVAVSLVLAGLLVAAQKEKADTKSLIGKPAPAISLQTVSGKDMSLAAEKGNVVLLDFWATWCPPCRESLPHLQAIHADEKLKEQGLKVYAVNEGEEKEKAAEYVKQNNFTFAVPLDKSGGVGEKYMVRGIPTTVVIGRDGKVKDVFIGFGKGSEEKIRESVAEALNAPKPNAGAKAE
jgi:thiol-disulfide isomerase/thioredoxin